MKVVVCAGGTGGHIYPALAIINKIKEKESLCEILYIGTTDRMESKIIPKLGIKFIGIEMKGIDRKNILKNFSVLLKYIKAKKKVKRILNEFKPDVVIGAGGYITAPVISVAHKMKIKTLIHEQNSIPGITNKHLAKYADKICVSLPDTINYFDNSKVVYTGNPRSEEVIKISPANKKDYGLVQSKKLVLIVMGSLGSTTMTKKIKQLIPLFNIKDYQVIVITGNDYYKQYKSLNTPKNVAIVPYLDNLINLLKSTDLIISRAGATTISEITAIGLPAILVPSPYVTNNHQYKNAKELEKYGACRLITEEEFSKESVLPAIDEILNDDNNYFSMKNASLKLGVVDSATKIYNEIRKLIEDDNNE